MARAVRARRRPTRRLNPFHGRWRIVSTPVWTSDALDDPGPAHLTFGAGHAGELVFIGISADIDYRVVERDGAPIAEFSWGGEDLDGHPVYGRGWARRTPEGLAGRLFIHESDESAFTAKPFGRGRLGDSSAKS